MVVFYCWIEGWLCNKDTNVFTFEVEKGAAGRDHHLFWLFGCPVRADSIFDQLS